MRNRSAFVLAVLLLLSSACGAEPSGADDGPAPLPGETYQRVLSQGVDPALVHLVVKEGAYDEAACERHTPSGPPTPVVSCEPDAGGWYRTGAGWHEYVVTHDGYHLTLRAPSAVVDREVLTKAALDARRQDGARPSPAIPSSPATRGDLPTSGDGAPVDPYGTSPPGG